LRLRPLCWNGAGVLFGDVLIVDDPDARALGERLRDPKGVVATAAVQQLDSLVAAHRPDLLVIAAPPHHALRQLARAVLHHPPCHVAVAPRGFAGHAADVRTIGLGYLDTQAGRAALDAARGLAFRWQAEIEAIRVVPHSHWPASDSGAGWQAIVAAERLSEIPGIHGTAVEGDVRQALSALARRVDLLVVGPRRHGPLVHLVRGDVLAHLARTSPCPVVLIDPRTTTA
jgi:nucleotide-binding universal stress UspA family protein